MVLAVGVVTVIGWLVLAPKLLVVRSVVVSGNHLVSVSQVRAAAGIVPKTQMLHVDTSAAASRVGGINQIQSATVSKSWPNRIVITVHERTPALAVASGLAPGTEADGYDLIDKAGVVVQSAKTRPAGMPVFQTSAAASFAAGQPSGGGRGHGAARAARVAGARGEHGFGGGRGRRQDRAIHRSDDRVG